MTYNAMKPYGLAIRDYACGDAEAKILCERDDGFKEEQPVSIFFRSPSKFFALENKALDLCFGRVLDIGAGVGVHSLVLQKRGLEVTAIDIIPEAIDVMKKAGVKDARCSDIFSLKDEKFDTLFLLGRGIGIAGNLEGLSPLLQHLQKLLRSGGQLLINSCDVRNHKEFEEVAYQERNIKLGRYIGEKRIQFTYKDTLGEKFSWIHVDFETLSDYAANTGWITRHIVREETGDYLCKLTLNAE